MPPSFLEKYGPWAVVTGASSGIGAEFATQLAAAGLSVALVARRKELLEELSATILSASSVQTKIIIADLATEDGVKDTLAATADLDVGLLVNNAGVSIHGSFFHNTLDEHLRAIRVNSVAVAALAHGFGRRMADKKRGGIIFVSSIAETALPWMATYSASKSFVSTMALVLRHELGLSGVEVMVLEAGHVRTAMTSHVKTPLMSAEDCVSQTLEAFGTMPRFTPGWKNWILTNIRRTLPINFQLSFFSDQIAKMLGEKTLIYADKDAVAKH